MTSATAAAIAAATYRLKSGHPWRNRFPTFTTDEVQKIFFGRARRQWFTPTPSPNANKSDGVPFTAKLQPIKPLTVHAAPYTLGTTILRAFIYARQHFPDLAFRWASAKALQTVYESNRIEGFPRVMFIVSKEVEKLLTGKLHGLLRRRFKTRARRAFIAALKQICSERKDFRCDLDIAITVFPGMIKVPIEETTAQMKTMLKNVYRDIAKQGLVNARLSKKYLAKRPQTPEHVLNLLARTLAREAGGIKEAKRRLKDDLSNMMERLPESTVEGRMSQVMLMEDGTYVPIEKESEPRGRKSLRIREWQASYPFQNAPEPTIPAEYLVTPIPTAGRNKSLSFSSSETNADDFVRNLPLPQSTRPPPTAPSTNANGASHEELPSDTFDWLSADEPSGNSRDSNPGNTKDPAKDSSPQVTLDWPPKAKD